MSYINIDNIGIAGALWGGYKISPIGYLLKLQYEGGRSQDHYTAPIDAYLGLGVAAYAYTQGATALELIAAFAVGQLLGWGYPDDIFSGRQN